MHCLKMKVKKKSLSRVQLFVTPWTIAYQVPPSMGFSRQEYWSGLPFPSPGDLPNPGIEPRSPTLQADSLPSEPPGKPHVWGKDAFLFILLMIYGLSLSGRILSVVSSHCSLSLSVLELSQVILTIRVVIFSMCLAEFWIISPQLSIY